MAESEKPSMSRYNLNYHIMIYIETAIDIASVGTDAAQALAAAALAPILIASVAVRRPLL